MHQLGLAPIYRSGRGRCAFDTGQPQLQAVREGAKALIWEDWREPLRGEAHGRGLGNYRLAAVAVLVTF